jgi:two-component system response regulator LytT
VAYDVFLLRAFKLNSIDYFLKAIEEEDLGVAVSKIKERLAKKEKLQFDRDKIKKMFSNAFEKEYKKRLSVKIGQHLKVI